ncbi:MULTISPECIES: hypothetical protein [unclassified Microcella]|uniref:hypothetical protein n=1 Tax=unclassified Microcella TaxID=2630066 RepID=UPI0006F4669C|nr:MULTISPECIES: hypothetical protein [unclassified Microcella]KQV26672.1 hypothetical protein ASC54_07430 [Yonghaparkia sp. Root332]KRF32555.1 hypothetical protein ASG83_00330 [Yonghaparkia sp. Soil809]
MPSDDLLRPIAVVRAGAGPWGLRLALAAIAMVAAATGLVVGVAPPGILTGLLIAVSLGGFLLLAASAAQITTRWRTSLRSDGWSLVVRSPFAVAEHSYGHELAIGRWLDARRGRPELWVIESGRIATPIGDALDPLRVEAFALAVGVPVVDVDGDPPSARGA